MQSCIDVAVLSYLGLWTEAERAWLFMLWKKFLRTVRSWPLWGAYAQNIAILPYFALTFKQARRLENDWELKMRYLTSGEMMKPTPVWCSTSLSSLDKTTQKPSSVMYWLLLLMCMSVIQRCWYNDSTWHGWDKSISHPVVPPCSTWQGIRKHVMYEHFVDSQKCD